MTSYRASHSSAACMRLLERFMTDLEEVEPVLVALVEEEAEPPADLRRAVLERLACALWGVFSHHRAVIDQDGAHYDLGSWRAAAEMIADLVNREYAGLAPPIRYMDCYMGVLSGEDRRSAVRELHRWIFARLHDAGCDWLYSYSATVGLRERRERLRELAAAMSRAYADFTEDGIFAPLPAVVAAYQDVYGRLPDGWPHA